MKKRSIGLMVVLLLVCAGQAMAYYNPSTGRFLSRDPKGELGFEAMQRAAGTVRPSAGRILQRGRGSVVAVRENQGKILNRSVLNTSSGEGKQELAFDVWDEENARPEVILRRNPERIRWLLNLYVFCGNQPVNAVDPLGLDVFNRSDLSVWVFNSKANPPWVKVLAGANYLAGHDTDGICPNVNGRVQAPDGTYRCLKTIDCYDAVVTGRTPGPYQITPVFADKFRGDSLARKCCCKSAVCSLALQSLTGGTVDPKAEFGSNPPDYP